MLMVIDSNRLQSIELREFLNRSTQNKAVLPDFAAMEAYKGNTLKSIFKSMEIVCEFPSQVVILKGSAKVCGLHGRRKGLRRRLIDEVQTAHFPEYARALRHAEAGNTRLRRELIAFGASSDEHLDKTMLKDAQEIRAAFDEFASAYTKEERMAFRESDSYTPAMIDTLVKTVLQLVSTIFQNSPLIKRRPSYSEAPNTFMFRVALACYLLGIKRASQSSVSAVKPEKIRNDLVDMMFVAYGTYFDGVLSADKNVQMMFTEVCLLLHGLFDAEVPAMRRLLAE
jgi:hypothetical protein